MPELNDVDTLGPFGRRRSRGFPAQLRKAKGLGLVDLGEEGKLSLWPLQALLFTNNPINVIPDLISILRRDVWAYDATPASNTPFLSLHGVLQLQKLTRVPMCSLGLSMPHLLVLEKFSLVQNRNSAAALCRTECPSCTSQVNIFSCQ